MNRTILLKWCRWHRFFLTGILICALSSSLYAETKAKKLWRVSAAVLTAATIADASSSWNQREGNPLLRGPNGQFGSQAIAIKGALVGSTLLAQHYLLKRKPESA